MNSLSYFVFAIFLISAYGKGNLLQSKIFPLKTNIRTPFENGSLPLKTKEISPLIFYVGRYNGKDFYIDETLPRTWNDANVYCNFLGGITAQFTTVAEKDFVYENTPSPYQYVWTNGDVKTVQAQDFRWFSTDTPILSSISGGYGFLITTLPGIALNVDASSSFANRLLVADKGYNLYPLCQIAVSEK